MSDRGRPDHHLGNVILNSLSTDSIDVDDYLNRLFPINRSLTGQGNRETLRILSELVPIDIIEYPVRAQVYDWVIPDEWSIHDAWIKDGSGNKLVDWKESNLHVVSYSEPVRASLSFEKLSKKLHYLPNNPNAIPYRTSYYNRDWGFCVTEKQYRALRDADGELDVCIDSSFDQHGSMTIGEIKIPGRRKEEYLVSTYICHPSMANDNLSCMITTALLAKYLSEFDTPEYSWRFVFVPETIGAIAYLKFNEQAMKALCGGFVVTCCGGPGPFGFKQTFKGDHLVDRVIRLAFRSKEIEPISYPFVPDGSDERQYSSPGFRIPVASITKGKYYEYSEYHTSLDNLEMVTGAQISEAIELYQDVITIIERNRYFRSTMQNGEVHLGSHGFYPTVGGAINQIAQFDQPDKLNIILWILFLADGTKHLVDIAERTGYRVDDVHKTALLLEDKGLLEVV